MKKTYAVALFGSQQKMAKALGISPQAVSQWPDDLNQARADRVQGCAMRLGLWPVAPKTHGVDAPDIDFEISSAGPRGR